MLNINVEKEMPEDEARTVHAGYVVISSNQRMKSMNIDLPNENI